MRPDAGCRCRSWGMRRAATWAPGRRGCCNAPGWGRRSSTWRGGCAYCCATFSASEPARLALLLVVDALTFGDTYRSQSGPSRVDLIVPVPWVDVREPRPTVGTQARAVVP